MILVVGEYERRTLAVSRTGRADLDPSVRGSYSPRFQLMRPRCAPATHHGDRPENTAESPEPPLVAAGAGDRAGGRGIGVGRSRAALQHARRAAHHPAARTAAAPVAVGSQADGPHRAAPATL